MAIINQDKCTGCKNCLILCPDQAIYYQNEKCAVDEQVCTECYVCLRRSICPYGAFEPSELSTFIKQFQHVISDPAESHGIKKGVSGRGAEEVKTLDVVARINRGTVSITIDMGRPGVGVYLRDAEKVAIAIIQAGVEIPPGDKSPLGALMPDRSTGKFVPEYLDYHLHSLIMEGTFPESQLATVLNALKGVENDIDTVFTVGLVMYVDENCYNNALDCLDELDIPKPHRGKVNVGLGRPLAARE